MSVALARDAERVAAGLPALVLAAERIAAGVRIGPHGRRRAGSGFSFWQSRPLSPHEPARRIDWRLSARTGRPFVRETEWEAAQTVGLWHATDAGMDWTGDGGRTTKRDRAALLTLALAALLLRGGERVRLLGSDAPPVATRLDAVAHAMAELPAETVPLPQRLPRHGRAVLVGDWLGPVEDTAALLRAFAARPVGGVLVQVLDPAELAFGYSGRVRFSAPAGGEALVIERAEEARERYGARLAAHRAAIEAACRSAGWFYRLHVTDQPAQAALLSLWATLAGEFA